MIDDVLGRLGLSEVNSGACYGQWMENPRGRELTPLNPATGKPLGRVISADPPVYDQIVSEASRSFASWRLVPAPRRGELVRRVGLALREHKADLGLLITLEARQIRSEGEGEVQEMIDMCDFPVGLSRQLYGLVIASERPRHKMIEAWHPLGPIGVITAFNFPAAVWAWNAMIAAVC